jgi:hypothetical protein
MSVTEDDLNRCTQILLRHGFILHQSAQRTETRHCPSPIGPSQNKDEGGYAAGMRRVSETRNLSTTNIIPPLPFTKKEAQGDESSQGEVLSFHRRSSLNSIPPEQNACADHLKVLPSKSLQHKHSLHTITMARQIQPQSPLTTTQRMFERMMLSENRAKQREYSSGGYRDDYNLGDVVKSASHMVIESTPERAIQAVDLLQTHDFAWIKRSNGLYTYAILAYRTGSITDRAPNNNDGGGGGGDDDGEYMYFVLNDCGATKMVHKKHWSKCIRLVHCKA